MWVNNSGPIAMHEPYKSDDISCKNSFGIEKGAAKWSRIIPGSECMKRLATTISYITILPRLMVVY